MIVESTIIANAKYLMSLSPPAEAEISGNSSEFMETCMTADDSMGTKRNMTNKFRKNLLLWFTEQYTMQIHKKYLQVRQVRGDIEMERNSMKSRKVYDVLMT